jgi:hypothetical protein
MRYLTFKRSAAAVLAVCFTSLAAADPIQISVHPDQVIQPPNTCLKGICIEDVNHEIYGGIYSQMIFGESFAEPAIGSMVEGFRAFGGQWNLADGVISIAGADGPKLISDHTAISDGTIGVELKFDNNTGENAGLIVGVSKPGDGADAFVGYEISLDPGRKILRLARHRQNYQLLRDVPCDVQVGQWISLKVHLERGSIAIDVEGKTLLKIDTPDADHPGTVGLRAWNSLVSFRNLSIQPPGAAAESLAFFPAKSTGAVSGMWQPVIRGNASGKFSLEREHPFAGSQSQVISFEAGDGEVGIENRGLNRWGMNFVAGQNYQGYLWVKAAKAVTLTAALESGDGSNVYARQSLNIPAGDWQRLDLALKPNADDHAGRFAIELEQPGSVSIGHVFLQPGEWGRFKGLPVRRDVVQGIIDQGVAVMRYGGSMVNSSEYRWKKMIGPRDRRPPYNGTWYPYSSNGWGVIDFLNLCEAANIVGVPDLNANESPGDMADFIEYVNGPPDSAWGRKRASDGHPEPYQLRYLEIGNEEKVDSAYAAKFAAIAEAIWAKDPQIVLIVGDFSYHKPITDPDHISGADGGISNLAGQREILDLARKHNREVWFDIHIWSEQLSPSDGLVAAPSYIDALDKLANGAKHRVLCFELNANSHGLRRGLANAMTINTLMRDNRMPIITSANGLQPDGQNDNGWNQGLLFLNPWQVWLQPPGYVTQMQAHHAKPTLIRCDANAHSHLDVTAAMSNDGKTLVLQVVNLGGAESASIDLGGFVPVKATAHIAELSGSPDEANTAENPRKIVPVESDWPMHLDGGKAQREFPAHSFTIIRFE